MRTRTQLIVVFIISALVCLYDVYFGLRGSVFSWILAGVMAFIALYCLQKLITHNYTT